MRQMIAAAALAAGCLCGCTSETPRDRTDPSASLPPRATRREQQRVALAARDALFQRLQTRLAEVMSEDGPVAAIAVCSEEAPRLTEQTGQQHGVAIGRTSHRLRNPDNAPPDWVRSMTELHPVEPEFLGLPGERLGALLPIRLNDGCLVCHGPPEQIPAEVHDALAEHYPSDQATGFREGDLRGWFWVEVPARIAAPPGDVSVP